MQSRRLFERNCLRGRAGVYPMTAENLLRVGLALCAYLRVHRNSERPRISIGNLDFFTLSLGAGFIAGGGDIYWSNAEEDISIRVVQEGEEWLLYLHGLEEHELRMVESLLFSRYNMPRAEGEEVGRVWIRGSKP